MFFRTLYLLTVVLGLCLCPIHSNADSNQDFEDEKARAREIQTQIHKTTEELMEAVRDEKQVMIQLDRIDRQLSQSQTEQKRLEKQAHSTQSAIVEAQSKVESLRGEIQRLKGPFSERLAAMYKTQKTGYPAMILSAGNPNEAYRRYRNLMLVVQQDVFNLRSIRDRALEWEMAKQRLTSRQDELRSLQRAQQEELQEIQARRAEKRTLLAHIKKRKDLQRRALRELETASAELNRLIRAHEKSPQVRASVGVSGKDSGFGHFKGRLPTPVQGTLKTAFGKQLHPLLRTYTLNNGVEIRAPEGAEIRAVHPGVVLYAGWVQGYGNVIIIDHGAGYYTLYGHASHLLKHEGATTQKEEVIGHIGDTGSLIGPSLYFEVREGGKPVDPMEWINLPRTDAKRR